MDNPSRAGGSRSNENNPTTPTRRSGKEPTSESSSATSRPPTPTVVLLRPDTTTSPSLSGSKRPLISPPKRSKFICPICLKDMFHSKALNGHIRWHTEEEREAKKLALKNIRDGELAIDPEPVPVPVQDPAPPAAEVPVPVPVVPVAVPVPVRVRARGPRLLIHERNEVPRNYPYMLPDLNENPDDEEE